MSHRAGSYFSKKKQERRERVETLGDRTQVEAYERAEKKGDWAAVKLGGSVVTKNPVTGAIAAKEVYDSYKEQNQILDSLNE